MVTVVSAAIVKRSGLVLLAQRSEDAPSYSRLWCTPGGKVKPNETLFDAICREISEEVGALYSTKLLLPVYEHRMKSTQTGDDVHVLCYAIEARKVSGSYACLDKTMGLGWFDAAGLYALRDARMLTPADEANIDALAALVRP